MHSRTLPFFPSTSWVARVVVPNDVLVRMVILADNRHLLHVDAPLLQITNADFGGSSAGFATAIKKADMAEFPEGTSPRRLTEQRTSRAITGCALTCHPKVLLSCVCLNKYQPTTALYQPRPTEQGSIARSPGFLTIAPILSRRSDLWHAHFAFSSSCSFWSFLRMAFNSLQRSSLIMG